MRNFTTYLTKQLNQLWYSKKKYWCYSFCLLSLLYQLIVFTRQKLYQLHIKKRTPFEIPIIIVGNITVGGSGKTPLVIWLVDFLKAQGLKPGLVSRGYGGKIKDAPHSVFANSSPKLVGDEAVMLVKITHCPMVVSNNRVAAVQQLIKNYDCNIIISDDGLQHYALQRSLEIAVIDGERQLGNGWCLPIGPLREPPSRLKTVDFIVINENQQECIAKCGTYKLTYRMNLHCGDIYNLKHSEKKLNLSTLKNQTIHAVAGIGHPQRFFDTLKNLLKDLNINIITHKFPDHYSYTKKDIVFLGPTPVILTEKDAVKCRYFANDNVWCLPVIAHLEEAFSVDLKKKLSIFL